MATSFNLGGLLGLNDGLGDLLTPEQQSAIQQRGLLSAAAALLQAGGPSTRRISLGQALGSALEAGQTGAQAAQQSALTQMLTRQKLEEARREAQAAENWQRLFGGSATPAVAQADAAQDQEAITPQQALAATGMRTGPTTARAAMIGQPMPAAQAAGAAAPTAANVMNLLTPEQRAIISGMKPQQGMQELMRISAQAAEFGPEQTVIRDGKPVVVRVNKLGQEQAVQGASPVEAYRFGEARMAVRGGKPVMIRTNQFGEEQVVEGAAPPESLQFGKAEPAVRNGKVVMVQTNPFGEERIVQGGMSFEEVKFGEAKPAVRNGQVVMVQTNALGEERIVQGATALGEVTFGEAKPAVRGGKPVMIRTNQFGEEQVVQGAAVPESLQFGKAEPAVRNGQVVMVQTNPFGEERIVSGATALGEVTFGEAKPAVRGGRPVMIRTNQFGEEQVVQGAAVPESLQFGKAEPAIRNGKVVMIQTNPFGEERVVQGGMSFEEVKFGDAKPAIRNGKVVMVQTNAFGEERIVSGAAPYQEPPSDIVATEYIRGSSLAGTGQPGMAAVGQYREQLRPSTTVTVADGQKGFENEMKLASAFKGEPIYKEFQGMRTAFNQVNAALDAGTPIGDLAGATKIMKLMDEGSVVRETELAMAMAASGRMDRLRNYFSLWASGNKLTPTQRDDFKALSNELYAAGVQAYNAKRDEYKAFGNAYKFKNLDAALGAPATAPSPAGGASQTPGGAARQPLSDIFTRPR